MTWFDVGLADGAALPDSADDYLPVRPVSQQRDNYSFSNVVANGVGPSFTLVAAGSGQTVNQTGGNLVITSGTTARSETIIRSNKAWSDSMTLRWATALSQRIVNQSFVVELVDVIGDGLAYTITSATAVTVTIPGNPFTASNVGQQVTIGNFAGTGTFLSGAAIIASVSGNDVTFTVSGFAAGTGTCSIWGWNFQQLVYSGTSATSGAAFNTQRRGWPRGATATSTSSTASAGHVGIIDVEDGQVSWAEQARGLTTSPPALRGAWYGDVPDGDVGLRLQFRLLNGSTAPASTTTWTIGFAAIENYTPQQVSVSSVRPQNPAGITRTVVESGSIVIVPDARVFYSPTAYSAVSTASTNAAAVKTTAGNLFEISVSNPTASAIFVKLYNKASAPTVGTDVPILTLQVAATTTQSFEFGVYGKRFATGIAIAATNGVLATDTTNAAAVGVQISASYV